MLSEKEFIEPIVPLHFYMRVKGSYLPTNAASREICGVCPRKIQGERERERKLEKRKRFKMHNSNEFYMAQVAHASKFFSKRNINFREFKQVIETQITSSIITFPSKILLK